MDTPPSTGDKSLHYIGGSVDIASQRRQALTRIDAPDKESVQSAPVTDRSLLSSGNPASLATDRRPASYRVTRYSTVIPYSIPW